jgi:hypothetical protein
MAKSRLSRGEVSRYTEPVAGAKAFNNLNDPRYVQSQAATFLCIGYHLRGDTAAAGLHVLAETGKTSARLLTPTKGLPPRDLQRLGFPKMSAGATRFRPQALQRTLGAAFETQTKAAPSPRESHALSRTLPAAAKVFYRDANAETAATLLEAGLRHPQELARVAAAASYFEVSTDPRPAIAILQRGLKSPHLLTRDVAAYALAHSDPTNPALLRLVQARIRKSTRKRSHTSLIVHGTWARSSPWWQPPNGNFWKYLQQNIAPDLYGAQDRFEWSGGYSDAARSLAGTDLHDWIGRHQLDGLDLFTHSHGGSVAMLANQACSRVGRMVLLSCPVHWPKYSPDFNKVGKVVSIRVHMDLVILADRGGQKFDDPRISENVLPVWFNHFATHDPATWQKYNIPSMI